MKHVDLVVENSGNAAAFDVNIIFTPQIEMDKFDGDREMPFENISILRPGQKLVSYIAEWRSIEDRDYEVKTTWKKHPKSRKIETLVYKFNTQHLNGKVRVGAESPHHQIAEQ